MVCLDVDGLVSLLLVCPLGRILSLNEHLRSYKLNYPIKE